MKLPILSAAALLHPMSKGKLRTYYMLPRNDVRVTSCSADLDEKTLYGNLSPGHSFELELIFLHRMMQHERGYQTIFSDFQKLKTGKIAILPDILVVQKIEHYVQ